MRVSAQVDTVQYHYEHDGEEFGSWSAASSSTLGPVHVLEDGENAAYPADGFKVPDGTEIVYVLWMGYGTGDSFGYEDGLGAILGVFGNKDVAEAAYKAANEQQDDFSIKTMDDFGREISMSNPGAGYFESIDFIKLDPVHVSKRTNH